jgi:MFS family permease
MLAVLYTVRLSMAFQFQSVPAVAPLLQTQFGVGIADIGFLIGLFFTPGVALALPGGGIGQWLGDRRTVLAALALMLAGSLAMAFGGSWGWQVAGRLLAGIGGVLINVQMTKMVADWFVGKEIATAMAIFVSSWPTGIALSLVTLPSIGTLYGVNAVHLFVAVLTAGGIALTFAYRPPANAAIAAASSARPNIRALMAVSVAGLIWGLFNVGFAVIFSFGPTMLVNAAGRLRRLDP